MSIICASAARLGTIKAAGFCSHVYFKDKVSILRFLLSFSKEVLVSRIRLFVYMTNISPWLSATKRITVVFHGPE